MRTFLRLVIENPIATGLAVALMTLAGLDSLAHMPVDLFPNLQVPVVNIITHYPGASPQDMELLISRPIEDQMRSAYGVQRVSSISAQGISRVTVEFSWGTPVDDARQLVQARLGRVRGLLPATAIPWIDNIGARIHEVCGYVVFGGGDSIRLRNIVRHDIAGRLMSVPGVSSVEVLGGDRRAFWVRFRPAALARLGLPLTRIRAILSQENRAEVAGYLDRGGRESLLRGDALLRTPADLRAIPLPSASGNPVPLGSVATVTEGRVSRHYVVRGDRVPAVALLVRKQPGASTTRVVTAVDREWSRLHHLLPAGSRVEKFYDQSEIIREAQVEILHDLVIGALLAVLVLYFFLGSWRLTLIVAGTIPVTLLAALALMHACGLSLNVITMTALALAIGMVVDDAIVVAENIYRHGQVSSHPRVACIEGAAEIAGPDASGTFTTVAAFLPLLVVTGIAAIFLRPFGVTISTALLASLLLSLTLVPMLLSRGGGPGRVGKDFPGARLWRLLDERLQGVLKFSFRHRWLTLGLATLVLGLAGLGARSTSSSLLPPIDEGAILAEYTMPPGTSLAESNRLGDIFDRIALADPAVACVYRRTGSPEVGYQIEGVNRGELMIKLKPRGKRRRSAPAVMAALRAVYSKFPGVVFLYHQPTREKIDESFSGLPALFGVTLYGPKLETLFTLAARVEKVLARDPAITNVINNTKVKASGVEVRVDPLKLGQYGVAAADVLATLRAARLGLETTRIVREKEEITVLIGLDTGGPLGLDQIRKLPVISRTGAPVPLDRVAEIRMSRLPASITRLNGQREVTLMADVEGDIPAVVSRLRSKFQSMVLPPGYSIDFTGQYKALVRTAIEVAFALAAAVILIYLIMAMQFRSWWQPLIILVTVPLSLAGGLVALCLSRQAIDVSVAMGAVTLAGVAVNNAIVLVDYANKAAAAGADDHQALLTAASVRLRPILLTSLTTIAALIPVAIGTTVGSKIFQPFAITVLGGLGSGTLATLVVVPTLATLRRLRLVSPAVAGNHP